MHFVRKAGGEEIAMVLYRPGKDLAQLIGEAQKKADADRRKDVKKRTLRQTTCRRVGRARCSPVAKQELESSGSEDAADGQTPPQALAAAIRIMADYQGKATDLDCRQQDVLRDIYWKNERPLRGFSTALDKMHRIDERLPCSGEQKETLRQLYGSSVGPLPRAEQKATKDDMDKPLPEMLMRFLQDDIDKLDDEKLDVATVGGNMFPL